MAQKAFSHKHPLLKASSWFLFTCLPRNVSRARTLLQTDVSCTLAVCKHVTYTSFPYDLSKIRLETHIAPMDLCLLLDKRRRIKRRSPCMYSALMDMHMCLVVKKQGTGQPMESPQAPSRPLIRAMMSCGIDRPSVTVSCCITVSERGTQKRKEEEIRRESGVERW